MTRMERRLRKIKNLKNKTAMIGVTASLALSTISVVTPNIVVHAESLSKGAMITNLEDNTYNKIEEITKLFSENNKDKAPVYKEKILKIKSEYLEKMNGIEDPSGIRNYYTEAIKKINEIFREAKKEEVKKITESKKAEEKKTDASKPKTPSNPDTGKTQAKPEEKKPEAESKDIAEDTLNMFKEIKQIYHIYKFKADFNKDIIKKFKDPVEYIYVYENEMKKLKYEPEKLKEYCKTNPKINELREIHKILKEERKKYDESKKAEEKKTDASKPKTPSNPDTGKTQAKPEEKKPEAESKDIAEDTLNMFKEIKQIYHIYKFKADFNKDIIKKFKDPVEYIYVYENEMKKLKYEPEKLKEYCKTNPKINELREIHKILKEERKKYDESKKAEEKKTDASKPETPSNPDTGKPQSKPEEKKPEAESKKEERKKYDESKKAEEKKSDVSKTETLSNPDTGKPQVKLEEKKPEVDVKQNEEKPDAKHYNKNTEKELNKDELNKSKPNEISMVKKENNKNVIKDQSKVMSSRESKAETKNIKDVPKTGEASSLPYIGGILISLAAFLKLNMKKFKKN